MAFGGGRSDCSSELVERGRKAEPVADRVDTELVVPSSQVLHERMPNDHHRGGSVAFEAAHRSQPRLQTAVVTLDPIVPMSTGVMHDVGQQVIDDTKQRWRLVRGHLLGPGVVAQDTSEEHPGCGQVTLFRDEHVDHLAVRIDGSVHVPPDAGDLHVGLIDEPAAPDGMAARSRRVDQLRREALHPPRDRRVVDVDTAFGEEFLDIAVGEPEPQVPTHGEHDHLRRVPEPHERRARHHDRTAKSRRSHLASLVRPSRANATEPLRIAAVVPKGSWVRADTPEIPPNAMREAVLNALAHRDYSMGQATTSIAYLDDRVEVASPGLLHFGLTPAILYGPHRSRPWNPTIARVMHQRGLIETWGTGFNRMVDEVRAAGLVVPLVADLPPSQFLVTFTRPGHAPHAFKQGLDPAQASLLDALYAAGSLSVTEAETRLGRPRRSIQRDFRHLADRGLVELAGSTTRARWMPGREVPNTTWRKPAQDNPP